MEQQEYNRRLRELIDRIRADEMARLGLSKKIGYNRLGNLISAKIAPILGEEAIVSGQSLQTWHTGGLKQELGDVSAQRLGVYLGYPARSAAEDLQALLKGYKQPAPTDHHYSVLDRISAAPLDDLVLLQRELGRQQEAIAARMETLLKSRQTLQEFLAEQFRLAGLDPGEEKDVRLFAKKISAKQDWRRIYRILIGQVTELDLELYEFGSIAKGLNELFPGSSWNQDKLIEFLKSNLLAQSAVPKPGDAACPGK